MHFTLLLGQAGPTWMGLKIYFEKKLVHMVCQIAISWDAQIICSKPCSSEYSTRSDQQTNYTNKLPILKIERLQMIERKIQYSSE